MKSSNIPKATGSVLTKFHGDSLAEGQKVSSNSPGHMPDMAVIHVHGKNL